MSLEMKSAIHNHRNLLKSLAKLSMDIQIQGTASPLGQKEIDSMTLAIDLVRSFLKLEIETLETHIEESK